MQGFQHMKSENFTRTIRSYWFDQFGSTYFHPKGEYTVF